MICRERRPPGRVTCTRALTASAQALNQVLVPLRTATFQVFQHATPPCNHREQSPAGMMVFLMRLEMILEQQNTLAQDCYLYFWRAGVGFVGTILGDYILLNISRQCHSWKDTPRLTLISFCTFIG